MTAEADLNRLLAEPPADAQARVRLAVDQSRISSSPIVLYGAGTLGRAVLARLREAGIEPRAFADDTPSKQGTRIAGLEVLSPASIVERFTSEVIFAVTILNPALSYLEAVARLRAAGARRVVSFLHLAWAFPEADLPCGGVGQPAEILAARDGIAQACRLLADDESRRQLVAHVQFRLHLDYDALPENSKADYFPADLLPAPLPPETLFVDCGAYDGDTIRAFLQWQHGRFAAIHAFEPDERTFARLVAYVGELPSPVQQRIHLHQQAVGSERRTARFDETGSTASALSATGAVDVDVVPIDDIVASHGGTVYIKYDIEGEEWSGLAGARRTILESRPLLAISAYHRPDDLWRMPLYLAGLGLHYSIYLRTQGFDGTDVVCYAIP